MNITSAFTAPSTCRLEWQDRTYHPYLPSEIKENRNTFLGYGLEEIERICEMDRPIAEYVADNVGCLLNVNHSFHDKNADLSVRKITAHPDATCLTPEKIVALRCFGAPKDVWTKESVENIAKIMICLADSEDRKNRTPYLVFSAPFVALGELRQSANQAFKQAREHFAGKISSADSSEERKHAIKALDKLNGDAESGNVELHVVCEVTNKDFPDVEGGVEDVAVDNIEDLRDDFEYFNGKRYPVKRGVMAFDSLDFDDCNNRLQDSSGTSMPQDECHSKLLDDANTMEKAIRSDALARRQEIIEARAITEEITVFEEDVRNVSRLVITDGNNRKAQGKYIVEQAWPGTARGYSRARVVVFRESDGITRELMDQIKNEKQKRTKVDHEQAQDAFLIYRSVKNELDQATEEDRNDPVYLSGLIEIAAKMYMSGKVDKAEDYYNTVKTLKEDYDWDDEEIKAGFFSVNKFITYKKETKRARQIYPKNKKAAAEVFDKAMKRIHLEVSRYLANPDSSPRAYTHTFLNGNALDDSVFNLMRVIYSKKNYVDEHKQLLQDWFSGIDTCDDTKKFMDCFHAADKILRERDPRPENIKTSVDMKLTNIENCVGTLSEKLRTLVKMDKDEREEHGFTNEDIAIALKRIQQVSETLSTLNGIALIIEAETDEDDED